MPSFALQIGIPGGPEIVIILLLVLLSFVVPLVVSYFVYRDAKRRNSRHALAWGLGAFFGSLVVWILYFVVRDEVGPGNSM
ncbi:MAG: hypothetical protein ABEI80_04030 [Haloplanus sp.]